MKKQILRLIDRVDVKQKQVLRVIDGVDVEQKQVLRVIDRIDVEQKQILEVANRIDVEQNLLLLGRKRNEVRVMATVSDGVGDLIRTARRALGVSQQELGKRAGVSERTLMLWETDRSWPRADHFQALARALYPAHPAAAAELARFGAVTLAGLGLEPERGASPAAPAVSASPDRGVGRRHVADAVLCAASEAADLSPVAVRRALLAAFEAAERAGLPLAELRVSLKREG